MAKLIIFDCDGVLVDSEPLANATESEHLARVGIQLTPAQARASFKGKTIGQVVALVQQSVAATLTAEWLHDLGMWTALAMVRALQPVSGVMPVLQSLRAAHIAMCVASQSSLPRVQLCLTLAGLESYFAGHVFTASMIARPKPAPDLFLYAAAQMRIDRTDCLVIEDSPSGVAAAIDAGMDVLGYACDEDAGALERAGAQVFHRMQELPALLRARSIAIG